MNVIDSFSGPFRFLSNFYPCRVSLGPCDLIGMNDHRVWPSVEHAFQAAKTQLIWDRDPIFRAKTAGEAKRLGRDLILRHNWDEIKLGVMEFLLLEKFSEAGLQASLLATGDSTLIEGNYWHDEFWGICTCEKHRAGLNHLGRLLEKTRHLIRTKQGRFQKD